MRTGGKLIVSAVLAGAAWGGMAGCTVHPAGERRERVAAMKAGEVYRHPVEKRKLPPLGADAPPEELVRYAQLSNAELEQRYWEWRAALEQVPQEGTQRTNLMLSFTSMITNGTTAASSNTIGASNDSMNSIVLPMKLETAAKEALERAKAAGERFDRARVELRSKVLSAYADYALTAEQVRLEKANVQLLEVTERIAASRVATGAGMQQDLLRVENELATERNGLAASKAQLPGELAAINALLGREAEAALNPPKALPAMRELPGTEKELLARAEKENPELKALARETAANRVSIQKAKQTYIPDFGVNVSTDLAGEVQSLMGSVVLPYLRYEAIDAQIRQSEAMWKSGEAARRQASYDVAMRVVADLAAVRDARRQVGVFEKEILPRAQRLIQVTQANYAAGQASMLDVLDAERTLIGLRRMVADLRTAHEKQLADLEAAIAF